MNTSTAQGGTSADGSPYRCSLELERLTADELEEIWQLYNDLTTRHFRRGEKVDHYGPVSVESKCPEFIKAQSERLNALLSTAGNDPLMWKTIHEDERRIFRTLQERCEANQFLGRFSQIIEKSPVDSIQFKGVAFLNSLYEPDDQLLICCNSTDDSQDIIWTPGNPLPQSQRHGWFFPLPVDGLEHDCATARHPKRRYHEAVTLWPFIPRCSRLMSMQSSSIAS